MRSEGRDNVVCSGVLNRVGTCQTANQQLSNEKVTFLTRGSVGHAELRRWPPLTKNAYFH